MKYSFLLISFFTISSLYGQEAFEINKHEIDISISEDGRLSVEESQKVTFREKRRGIIRKIPYKYEVDNRPYSINISNPKVRGHKFSTSKQDGNLVLKIGSANKYIIGSQQYDISYNVTGAIMQYEDHDEFYWNIVGFDRDAVTKEANFSIKFPRAWEDSITQFRAFAGTQGSEDADINLNYLNGKLSGATVLPLRAREGITIAVSIPKGLVEFPSGSSAFETGSQQVTKIKREKPRWVNWLAGVPIAIAGLLLMLWNKIKRAPEPSEVATQYYTPEDLSPAEVGTFYDYKVNRRDIISLLPYWGDLGYLEIESTSEDDMYFKKVKDLESNRPEYEHTYFQALFENRNGVQLSELKHALPTTMHIVSAKLKREVQALELYDARALWWHRGILIITGIVLILSGILFMLAFEAFVAGIGLFILGIASFIVHARSPQLSAKGIEYHNHLRGLYKWLKNPDPQEMSTLLEKDPSYLQHIFPYVLAFGLDESWERRWDEYDVAPPIWYSTNNPHGSRHMNYGQFTKDFKAHKIEQVFYTPKPPAPPSGGGGGFSRSGGSAGGGFGGGGTSSW